LRASLFAALALLLCAAPLAFAQGKIYFIQSSPDKIRKANLDGSLPQDLLALTGPHFLTLDFSAGKMYFSNDADGKIHRANLDGTGVVDLVTGLNEPGDPMYEVNVGNNATLNLSSGEYIFTKLVTQSESVLNFNVSGGAAVLNVCSNLSLGKKVTFNISPGGQANSHLVSIFAFQSSKVVVDKGGYVLGNLNAPNAEVSLGKNVSFRGAVSANKASVDRDVIFLHHSSAGVLPKQVLLDEKESDQLSAVSSYELEQNYPNPFNSSTAISFQLSADSEVKLVIYNTAGQLVRTLYSGEMPAGRFSLEWEGKNEAGEQVASGVYLAVFKAGEFRQVRRLVLMK